MRRVGVRVRRGVRMNDHGGALLAALALWMVSYRMAAGFGKRGVVCFAFLFMIDEERQCLSNRSDIVLRLTASTL